MQERMEKLEFEKAAAEKAAAEKARQHVKAVEQAKKELEEEKTCMQERMEKLEFEKAAAEKAAAEKKARSDPASRIHQIRQLWSCDWQEWPRFLHQCGRTQRLRDSDPVWKTSCVS